nr:glycosyltransferase family 4 protein [Actinomadura sp. J1-007]
MWRSRRGRRRPLCRGGRCAPASAGLGSGRRLPYVRRARAAARGGRNSARSVGGRTVPGTACAQGDAPAAPRRPRVRSGRRPSPLRQGGARGAAAVPSGAPGPSAPEGGLPAARVVVARGVRGAGGCEPDVGAGGGAPRRPRRVRRGGRAPARGPGRRPGALQGRPQRRGPAAVRPGGRGRTARGPRRPGPASGRAPRGLPRPRHAAEGQDVLLAAWPSVRARCPDALLALVGEDATAALADPAAAGRGEAGQVSVQGGLRLVPPVEDPRRWLAAADVVVMPSRWEGLPLTALEALATGRPLVGSAVPGLVEAAGPGTGALVPPEDVPALAAAVAARLLDPALAAAEGRAGTAWVEDFDADGTFALLAGVTWGLVGGDGVAGVGAWPGPGPGPAADGADPVAVLDGEGAGPV